MGNMLTQTDGGEKVTYSAYNARGLVTAIGTDLNVSSKNERYTYFADGSGATKLDRNGVTTSYVYDIHGRLTRSTTGTAVIAYTYDNSGNQLTMTDTTGTTTRTYDEQNRVLTKTVPNIGTTTFAYDIILGTQPGCIAETTADPKNNTVRRELDKLGRLSKVTASGGDTVYAYNTNGSLSRLTYPGGAYEEYTYYDNNRLKTLANKKSDGAIIDAYNYAYDAAGNRTQILDGKGTTTYEYDHLLRLKKSTEPDGRVTVYTFDTSGNRATETVTLSGQATARTYSYDGQNRLTGTHAVNPNASENDINFIYDNNGNLLSKTASTLEDADTEPAEKKYMLLLESMNSAVYDYDVWNNMTRSVSGGAVVENTYNGDGLRVSKSANGEIVNFLYEYDKVILEVSGSGAQIAANVYGTSLISRNNDCFMYNGHGDVTALVSGGTVVASYYYDAFGNHRSQDGGEGNPYRYSGYRFDAESGLYYLNARMYDPELARFMQEDTYRGSAADPLSLNLYTYCGNNPVMYSDSTGHYLESELSYNKALIHGPDSGSFDRYQYNEYNFESMRLQAEEYKASGGRGIMYSYDGHWLYENGGWCQHVE